MRIQLDLDEAGVDLVEELKRLTGSRTYKDLFNNALSLLDWSVRQSIQGRKITSVDENDANPRELVMPALRHSKSRGRADVKQPSEQEVEPVLASHS